MVHVYFVPTQQRDSEGIITPEGKHYALMLANYFKQMESLADYPVQIITSPDQESFRTMMPLINHSPFPIETTLLYELHPQVNSRHLFENVKSPSVLTRFGLRIDDFRTLGVFPNIYDYYDNPTKSEPKQSYERRMHLLSYKLQEHFRQNKSMNNVVVFADKDVIQYMVKHYTWLAEHQGTASKYDPSEARLQVNSTKDIMLFRQEDNQMIFKGKINLSPKK